MTSLAKLRDALLRALDGPREGVVMSSGRLLDRVRGLFLAFMLLNGAMVILQLPAVGGTPWAVRGGAADGVVCACLWFVAARRLGRFKLLWDIGLAVALCAAGLGVGTPLRALGLFYTGIYLRSFYGPAPRVAAAAVYFFAALVVASVLSPETHTAGILSPDVLTQFPGFAMSAAVTHLLTRTLVAHERRAIRQAVLTRAGSELLGVSHSPDLHRIATKAILELVDDPSARSSLALIEQDGSRVRIVAAAGATADEMLGVSLPVAALSPFIQQALADGQPFTVGPADRAMIEELTDVRDRGATVFVAPLMAEGQATGALSVDCLGTLPDDLVEDLALLAAETSLAMERLLVGERLRRSEERFRSVVQNASDIVSIVTPEGVRYVSPAVERVLGYPPSEVEEHKDALIHQDDRERVAAAVVEAFGRADGKPIEFECRVRHADGSWRAVETVAKNLIANEAIGGVLLTTRDVTDRTRLESELRRQAFHDELTGLPNRALLGERLVHALARLGRHPDSSVVLLFLDLDDFKVINDSVGHTAGDELLVEVAKRLDACTRAEDTCARLGGDEFAILLEDADVAKGERLAERVLEALREPLPLAGRHVAVRASIGIAESRGDVRSDVLLANADMAMYEAKRAAHRYHVYRPAMRAAADERLQLRQDLAEALVHDQFELHYQPIVDLERGAIAGAEALLRWRHPERGMVSPLEFIDLAEQTGLIVPIGQWVLAEATRQCLAWQREGVVGDDFSISVNVSPCQLQDAGFVAALRRILGETGLEPGRLVLELTESVLLDESAETVERLRVLRRLGAQVAIDDFGTGYSSLSYLGRLPVDIIKIDQSFIQAEEATISPLVAGIVQLATSLELSVVAEGIEEHHHVAQLIAAGCPYGQGFVFSRPLDPSAMSGLLAGWGDPRVALG
jgi:diguanylate cyclase (GGDEF)-like protein/PAS domain S-box-containing protein